MAQRTILVIDDDQGTRETFMTALRLEGYAAVTAPCGADALTYARQRTVDAMVVDLRLPDMSGNEVALHLQRAGTQCPFILVSGFMTTAAAVLAMRLGAADVLEKPLTTTELCRAVARALFPARWGHVASRRVMARSSANRWATAVMSVCNAEGDPRTLTEWAHLAGLSYSSLRELCRILGINPLDARDFARMLRAVVQGHRMRCAPSMFLDVSDSRTLQHLFKGAGFDGSRAGPRAEDFLDLQQFIDPVHPALCIVRLLLAENVGPTLSGGPAAA